MKVCTPQLSDGTAVPRAVAMACAVGLHPSAVVAAAILKVGGVISTVQLAVLTSVAILPQVSMAVKVRTVVFTQPMV